MKDVSDDTIIELLNDETQSEKGFRLLMQKYQERMYWHIRRMVKEHDDANDIIQNTFIKVFRNFHQFQGKSKLYTWLYRIATNETISFLRKVERTKTASLDDEMNLLGNQLKADDFIDGNEVEQRLKKALEKLPPKQRLVFNMRYYDELSYKEISEILDTSVGGLKASYHHAVKKIEAYFRKVGLE